jgi:hypothetical protein
VRMQVGRVVAAVAVIGAVISGCGGPAQAGTAVFVGEQAIPLERIQTQLDAALANEELISQFTAQGGSTADVARSIVTREIVHNLLSRSAAQQGIVVTDEQVDAQIAQSGGPDALLDGSLFDLPALREQVRDELVAAQLAQRQVPGLEVTVDIVGAFSRDDAQAKAEALAAGGPQADALTSNPQIGRSGLTVQAVSSPGDAATPPFALPVGSVVAFQPDAQQSANWLVIKVTDRRTDAPTDPAALAGLSLSQLVAIGERTVQQTAQEVGVRINPRYGVWDPIRLRVVAEDQQSGMILLPTSAD